MCGHCICDDKQAHKSCLWMERHRVFSRKATIGSEILTVNQALTARIMRRTNSDMRHFDDFADAGDALCTWSVMACPFEEVRRELRF